MKDPVEWGRSIAKAFKEHLAEALEPINARLKALEEREPVELTVEETEPVDVDALVADAVAKAVSEIPVPKDGRDGIDGKDGESVDPAEVERMVGEAVEKAVSAIPTPKDGKDADPEQVERLVSEGVSKAVSEALPAAKAELLGVIEKAAAAIPVPRDGKDAAQIDILPTIDFGKTYERGTWAMHDGGLWRAHSNTVGSRGWECVMRGVAKVDLEWENERTLVRREVLSDGTVHETRQSFPVVIYRDVFKEGAEYAEGDAVTFGGSLWICRETTTEKPGQSDAWRLSAKKGRDAK